MSRRNRASLRGKGWNIFFGKDAPEHIEEMETRPPGQIDLTPDETEEFLSVVPQPLGLRDTSEIEPVNDVIDPYSTIEVAVPDGEDFLGARLLDEDAFGVAAVDPAIMATIDSHGDASVVEQLDKQKLGPEHTIGEIYDADSFSPEAVPVVESVTMAPVGLDLTREKVVAHREVEDLTPRTPETLDNDAEDANRQALAKLGASKATDVPDFAKKPVKKSDIDLLQSSDGSSLIEESKG